MRRHGGKLDQGGRAVQWVESGFAGEEDFCSWNTCNFLNMFYLINTYVHNLPDPFKHF